MIRMAIETILRRQRISATSVGTLAEAREKLTKGRFDLLFVDLMLPDGNGKELIEELNGRDDPMVLVSMTGNASIESAVECMKAGADDYLVKPFDTHDLLEAVKRAEKCSGMVPAERLQTAGAARDLDFIGESEPVQLVRRLVRRVAPTEATVLITGENGTGKEVAADRLHRLSRRAGGPFVKVNCAAISETLIESEFFGHEKGAFTGAAQTRKGRFEQAHGGTILLDEVSEISPSLQAKLLRVLQEREFERVGGNETIKVDVRLIAATNRDLLEQVKQGKFREDLYYRLNVFPLHLPPLRERGADAVLLAEHFLQSFAKKNGVAISGFSKCAVKWLQEHTWPGNVRELQNTIERAVILTEDGGKIDASVLEKPFARASGNGGAGGGEHRSIEEPSPRPADDEAGEAREILPLDAVEQSHILNALKSTNGNRTRAADRLGISIRTLRNKLAQYHSVEATR